jgi:hypothetical protein
MFVLESGIYRPADDWGALVAHGKQAMVDALGCVIAEQVDAALQGIDRSELRANMVVTTMLDMPFTSGWLRWPDLQLAMRRHTNTCPETLLSAYECSSWGFALRYAKSLEASSRRLPPLILLTILDINILNLSHWYENPNWGRSGFGIATVVLRCTDDDHLSCNIAKAANGFGEFCVDLRNRMFADTGLIVTPPFFPKSISVLYDRLLPSERLLPNRVDVWGHSFGADPWISLIEQRWAHPDRLNERYLATSVSLNGYWCTAELKIGSGSNFRLLDRLPCPKVMEAA